MPTLPQIKQFQIPNVAGAILQGRSDRAEAAKNLAAQDIARGNLAVNQGNLQLGQAKFKQSLTAFDAEEGRNKLTANKDRIDFALNVFSNVQSEDDLRTAGKIFLTRFPDEAGDLDQLFPAGYDSARVDFFRRSLIDAKTQAELKKPRVLSQGQQLVGPTGERLGGQVPRLPPETKTPAPSSVMKLIQERAALVAKDPNDPNIRIFDQAINKAATRPKGEQINIDPKTGEVTITRGGDPGVGGDTGLGKSARGVIQKDLIDASANLVRLSQIERSIDERSLTAVGKFDLARLSLLEKINPAALSGADRQTIDTATTFFTDTLNNLNITLSDLSGAAVSNQEFERISGQLPDPGKKGFLNVLSGDSRTEFFSKVRRATDMATMAVARLSYINRNGFEVARNKQGKATGFFDDNGDSISLGSMPKIMNDRAAEIGKELRAANTGTPFAQLKQMVNARVNQEFGLTQ